MESRIPEFWNILHISPGTWKLQYKTPKNQRIYVINWPYFFFSSRVPAIKILTWVISPHSLLLFKKSNAITQWCNISKKHRHFCGNRQILCGHACTKNSTACRKLVPIYIWFYFNNYGLITKIDNWEIL